MLSEQHPPGSYDDQSVSSNLSPGYDIKVHVIGLSLHHRSCIIVLVLKML